MKRQYGLIISFISLFQILNAQLDTLWNRTYGGSFDDIGYSVQQTSDSGFIVAGSTESFGAGDSDIWLIRTNVYGDTIWTRIYGGSDDEDSPIVHQTSDEGFMVVGSMWNESLSNSELWLVRTDAQGDTLWTQTDGNYGGWQRPTDLQPTSDDGFIVVKAVANLPPAGTQSISIRLDSLGNTIWERVGDYHNSAQQTTDGGFIMVGDELLRTDAQGDSLWARPYGGNFVRQTTDGGYIIVGDSLIKTDSLGNEQWSKGISGNTVQQTIDGGYIIADGNWAADTLLIKTDSLGNEQWSKEISFSSVQQTYDGGFILVGSTDSFGAGLNDVFLIKTDSLGNFVPLEIVDNESRVLPQAFTLYPAYPNPFNPVSTIRYDLPQASDVSLFVYDLLGREVARLVDSYMEPGYHQAQWNGRSASGREVPSGIYIARLVTPEYSKSIKMLLLK